MRQILLWLTTCAAILGGAHLSGIKLQGLINTNALLMVFGPVVLYMLFAYGVSGYFNMVNRFIEGKLNNHDEEHLHRANHIGFLAGGIGTLLGMIHVFTNMGQPSRMGAGIAMAILCAFYGAIPTFFCTAIDSGKHKKPQLRIVGYWAASIATCFLLSAAVFYSTLK